MSTTISNALLTSVLLITCVSFEAAADASDPECEATADFATTGAGGDKYALIAEAARGDVRAVRVLLDKGMDPDFSDPEIMTPLAWAARCKHVDVARALLDAGAQVDLPVMYQRNSFYAVENSSALIWAAAVEDREVICFLLSKNADVSRKERVYKLNADGSREYIGEGRDALSAASTRRTRELIRNHCGKKH